MPQCQFPVFCCFWFLKSYTENILGIGRNKSRNSYFPRNTLEHRRSGGARPGAGHTCPWRGQTLAAPWGGVGHPLAPDSVLSPINCLSSKNHGTEIRNPRKVL